MKQYFKCFRLFLETGKKITDVNLKAQYYESLLEYGLDGTLPNDPMIDALLTSAMYSIDKSEELSETKSEYMKGNTNAKKDRDKLGNHIKTEKNREKQTETEKNRGRIKKNRSIEDIEEIEDNKKEKINKKKYLDFVYLTSEEYAKLQTQLGQKLTDELIDKLNNYIGSTGKRYRNHYFTILNRSRKEQPRNSSQLELMKERERQRIREEAQAILTPNQQNDGESIQNKGVDRRTSISGC